MSLSILVPIDGSAVAEHAVPVAARIARCSGGTVYLCRVVDPAAPAAGPARLERERSLARGHLRALRHALADRWGVAVRVGIRTGAAAPSVLRAAEAIGADLIILTKQGAGERRMPLLGSTANEIVHRTGCAVLLLPPRRAQVAWDAGAYRRILLPLDGGVDVEPLLAAIVPMESGDGVTYGLLPLRPAARQRLEKQADGHPEASPGVALSPLLPPRATSAFSVLRAAREFEADLIAFGLPARSSTERARFGALLEPLLRVASVPVLLHRRIPVNDAGPGPGGACSPEL